ncbi:sialic acid-binding Ig-like lectin 12 isoform X2 [Anabas testudineus]|uniref:Ig-like domain-containing protein n=1 Tax=Anabas testudineus TaxID=64144 RepID=A0AAQ6IH77_ANATE|nr:sialic acid-binding Ig-like lectin 12 isoform X2 [Anabas testudineus]
MLLMSLMTVLSVNMVTVNMLLSVFFLPGALADCSQKKNLVITAPQKIEALSGSCLMIPCNFSTITGEETFDSSRQIFGVWIKNNSDFGNNPNNVIYHSSKTFNIYPMNITGNLSQTNCTTLFSNLTTTYTDTYYFRIENGPFKATAVCDPLQITVKDSPQRPRIKISKVNLTEKESVTISCSAFTPCPHSPPKLTWSLQQDPHNNREENTDGTFTTQIQETITLSDKHDGYNISCSATYPVNEGRDVRTAETQETLSVSYAPKDTSASISPSGLVSAGSWVNLTCSSRAKPPVSSFTWFKISTDGDKTVSEGDFYRLNVTDGGVYYCVATNQLGNQTSPEREIHLNIKGEPPVLPVLGGIFGIIILICLILCICYLKSKHQTAQQSQSQTGEDLVGKKEEENIHYGEIDFSELQTKASSNSVQDSGRQQDTVYSQVKMSKTANSLSLTADPEDLYAQVKK